MARGPRKLSETGVYHIMIRGVDKSLLFFDDEDRIRFLHNLKIVKEEENFILYAYCLMDNHVHLLMKDDTKIHQSMKRINVRHAVYINRKYGRVGHLFQDRFRSEQIESDSHLLTCVRYIHNNPRKAGLVKQAEDYIWSSYLLYLKDTGEHELVDRNFILGYFDLEKDDAKRKFAIFSTERNDDAFLDVKDITDKPKGETASIIESLLNKYSVTPSLLRNGGNVHIRRQVLREIREKAGISVIEISNLLGISVHKIYRC